MSAAGEDDFVLIDLVGMAVLGVAVAMLVVRRRDKNLVRDAEVEADRIRGLASVEAEDAIRRAGLEGREHTYDAVVEEDKRYKQELASLESRMETSGQKAGEVEIKKGALDARESALLKAENDIKSRMGQTRAYERELEEHKKEALLRLEKMAGETATSVTDRLRDGFVEETKAQSAARLRVIDASGSDPEHGRQGKRLMGIAMQRFQGHYLTERLLSSLPLDPSEVERVIGPEERNLRDMEELTGLKVTLNETRDAIRLEGLDGVAREAARRAIRKLQTPPQSIKEKDRDKDVRTLVQGIQQRLEQEIVELGRKAFEELEVSRAHPEIVKLVGRLNYRTSYTQNQWKHAVEAAFLCGMMASELGLDIKIARRAALMHDIGKSLTHAMDGSHAVIGADYARRLGESELVANAIGAHHADEPCNSTYAYIVAAADALSGGRPGARREQTESYVKRLEDLERLGRMFRGVTRVDAVGGGREVRVYVKEGEVSDLGAVEMSQAVARKISDELVFPGQIKVTIIRQTECVAFAR